MKHRKGLKGQLEEMLNNAKSLQIYDVIEFLKTLK